LYLELKIFNVNHVQLVTLLVQHAQVQDQMLVQVVQLVTYTMDNVYLHVQQQVTLLLVILVCLVVQLVKHALDLLIMNVLHVIIITNLMELAIVTY